LPPRIERKVFAVPLARALEVLRRHPIFFLAKLFFVGNVAALSQKNSQIFQGVAFHGERLRNVASEGKS
jgi:hypothetical protein